ncbi:hypothetical protein QA584_25855 [Anaerocolumna sp. AGMB13025]|uniref:hypothetical protein n=1 Tax=Anaerocolumna sp. AGMB13025 TaxID=3039116 RepID=UPI00241BEB7B|nr:hypothetical protein [Anaerocolumna sp. AGMB13025]WFR56999.1 hypothetical protein QA584_25855 [Anaerocolumna sp. AGMB13025]
MKRNNITIARKDNNLSDTELMRNKEFLSTMEASLLSALFEKEMITRCQFDQCLNEINVSLWSEELD